jgi:hypothetical protein
VIGALVAISGQTADISASTADTGIRHQAIEAGLKFFI